MRELKIGDRVRILKHEAFASSGAHQYMYGNSVGQTGVVTKNDGDRVSPYHVWSGAEETGDYFGHYGGDELELIEGGSMKAGDILVDNDGCESKVLLYLNQGVEIYLISEWGNLDEANGWYTAKEIERHGWKLKGDIQVEMSVADIEKQLKVAPGSLRIKKESEA